MSTLPSAVPGPARPRPASALRRIAGVALLAVLVLAGPLVPAAGAASDPCSGGLLGRVQSAYQALRSFQASFTQVDHQADGQGVRAQGTVAYLKPGRMRWAYEPPNEQLLVTDGETVWLYDPLLDNVTVQPLDELTRGTPLAFLLGAGNLEADFTCRAPTQPAPPENELTYLELVPREPIPALAFIQLGVHADTARIAALRMVDTQGNLRRIRFDNLQTDVELSSDLFTFKVTPGMEVITKEAR